MRFSLRSALTTWWTSSRPAARFGELSCALPRSPPQDRSSCRFTLRSGTSTTSRKASSIRSRASRITSRARCGSKSRQRHAAESNTGVETMEKLVLIGNGMAGIGCLEQILRHDHNFDITVFGDETHGNYNRIMLSSVLAGEKKPEEIMLNDLDWYRQNNIDLRLGVRIIDVDPVAKTVTGNDGSVTGFDKLLLAT